MDDNKLAVDEARRTVQHESIKTKVENDVNAEITAHVDRAMNAHAKKVEGIAGELHGNAIEEVLETEREVGRGRAMTRLSQIVDYIFYIIYTLLAMRLLLGLIAARSSAGFVQFIHAVTGPLYAPFRGIVASPALEGGYTLAIPIIVAILVYAVVHAGINGLLRLITHRKTEI